MLYIPIIILFFTFLRRKASPLVAVSMSTICLKGCKNFILEYWRELKND